MTEDKRQKMSESSNEYNYIAEIQEDEEETIYSNIDTITSHNIRRVEKSDMKSNQTPQQTGRESVRSRSSRAAIVCLGLLCVLLLAAVIVLCVQIITERDQFHIKSKNYTEERDQLLTKNTNLINQREALIQEKNELWKCFCEMDAWIYYQFSLYYVSCKVKSWNESRQDCLKRGADLIIINNREEQDFVKRISGNKLVWIGLSDTAVEGIWKWVDGSSLTSGFWMFGWPFRGRKQNCAATVLSLWSDYSCNAAYKWICEKNSFK